MDNMVDIKEVEKIIKEKEDEITREARSTYFSEKNRFFDKVRHLKNGSFSSIIYGLANYGIIRYVFYVDKEDEISMEPTHAFIRALASGDETENIPNFQELVDELAGSNLELADYLIARNSNVAEETRNKIALKSNVDSMVLTELARTTKNVKLLEVLIDSENDDVKVAVLNNPVFSTSEDNIECFDACIEKFSIGDLEKLKNIPKECKDNYIYFSKLRAIETRMSYNFEKMEDALACGEDYLYQDASNEYNELQQEYEELKCQRLQK